MSAILFVCSGNTCRSPMAAALAARYLAGTGAGAASAGVAAASGQPASLQAQSVMAERGLSLAGHRSRRLTGEDVERADLVLTMEEWQRLALAAAYPAARIATLAGFAGQRGDVADPAGGGLAVYRRCARELDELVRRACDRWISLAPGRE